MSARSVLRVRKTSPFTCRLRVVRNDTATGRISNFLATSPVRPLLSSPSLPLPGTPRLVSPIRFMSSAHIESTLYNKSEADERGMDSGAPIIPPNVEATKVMLEELEKGIANLKKKRFTCKKTTYRVPGSETMVSSWRFKDSDYKRLELPTCARGLFTAGEKIVARGYDKFFNVGEVKATKWENMFAHTKPPYELTLKENGCIIFLSGLEDGTLLVCSKHSVGGKVGVSHAFVGQGRVKEQLAALGKTEADLAYELRRRNATAVAELCDDSFEEHVLAYGPESAGLYLHGINLNLPDFATYSSAAVQKFADTWGFRKTGVIVMHDLQEAKEFLENVAKTGHFEGRDIEGFVIRCKRTQNPMHLETSPYHDWFFKFKFDEPYLMYRQWRECTKSLIAGKKPLVKKHIKITKEYLDYAAKRLAQDPQLGERYNQNHGIIALRDDFLDHKRLNGREAANMMDVDAGANLADVTKNVVLCPIATVGCGKTTLARALTHLFGWGHIQNDDITGSKRPPRFSKAIQAQLQTHKVVFADRNNCAAREREQIIDDLSGVTKNGKPKAQLICLHYRHDADKIAEVERMTRERIQSRGDNHQTIHASKEDKYIGIIQNFIKRFEPCNPDSQPDCGFGLVIDLDPLAGSRANLETTVTELHEQCPGLVPEMPSAEQLDKAIEVALAYRPSQISDQAHPHKGRSLPVYFCVQVPAREVRRVIEEALAPLDPKDRGWYDKAKRHRRFMHHRFHVTLMHFASMDENPKLWQQYMTMWEESSDHHLGKCSIELERVVFNNRIMAVVARIIDKQWRCLNRVAHVTAGTENDGVRPKESNDLLAKWLDEGTGGNGITELVIKKKRVVECVVKADLGKRPRYAECTEMTPSTKTE